jgi:hypothetical protein
MQKRTSVSHAESALLMAAQITPFRTRTGGYADDQVDAPYRRLRVRVATATRPRTVIGIRADA